jgi:hypothetical protein
MTGLSYFKRGGAARAAVALGSLRRPRPVETMVSSEVGDERGERSPALARLISARWPAGPAHVRRRLS